MPAVLVIDLGTTGVRALALGDDGRILASEYAESLPRVPGPALVEHDPVEIADLSLRLAEAVIAACGFRPGHLAGIGIAVQRATTVLWDATTGDPVGPAISWQDLRTLGDCLGLAAQGFRMPPNASGTKAAWLFRNALAAGHDPDVLRFGTLDTWLAWRLSGGEAHVTDRTNACTTAMLTGDYTTWDPAVLDALGLPETLLPDLVATSGVCGTARLGGGETPLAALVGDQQASLVGQGGIRPGVTKTTCGTACMTDVTVGPSLAANSDGLFASYPVVAHETAAGLAYGLEATVITGGEAVRLLTDLGVAGSPSEVSSLASSVADAGGCFFVPALLGLGTPRWDYGARGTFVGMSLGTGRAELARAVLEGVAARVAECVRRIEDDTGRRTTELRVDGGAAAADVLCQSLADILGIAVARSAEREATALGAGLLAGLATGVFNTTDLEAIPAFAATFEPRWADGRRSEFLATWDRAVSAAAGWIPELSGLRF